MAKSQKVSMNDYVSLRVDRIAEIQARMEESGVQKRADDVKAVIKVTKSPRKLKTQSDRKSVLKDNPSRRSERLKARTVSTPNTEYKTPQRPPSSDTKKNGLFESDNDSSPPKIATGLRRYNSEENVNRRPANSQLPQGSLPNMRRSTGILASSFNGKSKAGVYDSVLGIRCHFCRQTQLCGEENCKRCRNRDVRKGCIGKTDCSMCHSSTGVLCRPCLKLRYGEDIEKVRENRTWLCSHCSETMGINPYWICNSSLCLIKRINPIVDTLMFQSAREMGYASVAHYLADVLRKRDSSTK